MAGFDVSSHQCALDQRPIFARHERERLDRRPRDVIPTRGAGDCEEKCLSVWKHLEGVMLRTLFRFRHNLRCTPYCGNPRNSWTGGAGTKVNAVIGPPGRPAQVRGVTQSYYRRPTPS